MASKITRVVGYEGQLDQYDFSVRRVQQLKAGETRVLVKQHSTIPQFPLPFPAHSGILPSSLIDT